jgi:hypothetical protein
VASSGALWSGPDHAGEAKTPARRSSVAAVEIRRKNPFLMQYLKYLKSFVIVLSFSPKLYDDIGNESS